MKVGAIPNLIVQRYENAQARRRPLMLEGKSGIGKSYTVHQAAKLLAEKYPGFWFNDGLRLSQCDSTDLRGVPSVQDGVTVWNRPSSLPGPEVTHGILFIDELTSAPPSVLAAAYQLMLDHALGDYKLPEGVMVVAAGNEKDDRGVTFAMPAPLRNRMTTIKVETVFKDDEHHQGWLDYAARRGCDPRVMSYLMNRTDHLHHFTKEDYGNPFPSPRAWLEGVSVTLQMNFDADTRIELIRGDIGPEAAASFETHLRIWATMPSINKILEQPDEVDVPSELHVQYCIVMGLAARMDRKTFANAYRFLTRMKKELQTLCVMLAYHRDNDICRAPDFSDWAVNNKEAFRLD